MKRSLFVVASAVFALTLSLAGPVAAGGRPFHTVLLGSNEVPAAEPTASGTAQLWLNPGQGRVCWNLTATGLSGPAVAAHIHAAPAGVNGSIVIPLSPPDASGSSSGCATGVARTLIKAIIHDPAGYYVNIHDTVFPGGAIRGQLSRSSTHETAHTAWTRDPSGSIVPALTPIPRSTDSAAASLPGSSSARPTILHSSTTASRGRAFA